MATKKTKMTIQAEFNDILSNQLDDVKKNKARVFINKARHGGYHVRLKEFPHASSIQQSGLEQVKAIAEVLTQLTPKQRPPVQQAIAQYGPAEGFLWGVYIKGGEVQDGISTISLSALHRWAIAVTGKGLEIYYHGKLV